MIRSSAAAEGPGQHQGSGAGQRRGRHGPSSLGVGVRWAPQGDSAKCPAAAGCGPRGGGVRGRPSRFFRSASKDAHVETRAWEDQEEYGQQEQEQAQELEQEQEEGPEQEEGHEQEQEQEQRRRQGQAQAQGQGQGQEAAHAHSHSQSHSHPHSHTHSHSHSTPSTGSPQGSHGKPPVRAPAQSFAARHPAGPWVLSDLHREGLLEREDSIGSRRGVPCAPCRPRVHRRRSW